MATSKDVAAVILAGGLGTRLRSVLPDLPKPMAPVAGRPFIEWVLRYLVKQGIHQIVISTGYRAECFESYFAQHRVPSVRSLTCVAEPVPQGTAGGFFFAIEQSGLRPEAWLVLNGDSLFLGELDSLCADVSRIALLAKWTEDASRYGSLDMGDRNQLRQFSEKRPGPGWINAGVYLIPHSVLSRMPAQRPLSWETDVFPTLLASGEPIAVTKARAPFIDIGIPSALAEADEFVRTNLAAFALD
jgi:D-glycero-alpha-D-manno-heptose 1-phosphate guanylyltransferase